MRTIERAGQFKRDYKREAKGQHRLTFDDALLAVLKLLIADKPVPAAGVGTTCWSGAVCSVSRYTKLQAGGFEHGVESPDRRVATA